VRIRRSDARDHAAIESLYSEAFPDEDLLPLLRDLLTDSSATLSLVAQADSRVAGHIVFSRCGIEYGADSVLLLGPLAVARAHQRQGIGTALVRHGLQCLADSVANTVCVLGDPAYYGRLGFEAERRIIPPYPIPQAWRDAWQSLQLRDDSNRPAGRLVVPAPWRRPELWGDG